MNYKGLGEKAEKLKDLKFLKLERDVPHSSPKKEN